jgi:hypothetical protein
MRQTKTLTNRIDFLRNNLKLINGSKAFCLERRRKARGQWLNLSKEVDFEEGEEEGNSPVHQLRGCFHEMDQS